MLVCYSPCLLTNGILKGGIHPTLQADWLNMFTYYMESSCCPFILKFALSYPTGSPGAGYRGKEVHPLSTERTEEEMTLSYARAYGNFQI